MPLILEFLLANPSLWFIAFCLWLVYQLYGTKLPWVEATKWTKTKREFKSEVKGVEERVDCIAKDVSDIRQTQEDHLKVTRAQTRVLNGSAEGMNVQAVEEDIGPDSDETSPEDYLAD